MNRKHVYTSSDALERKKVQKKYQFNKIFQIMSIYIKYLLGDDVNESEQEDFLEYCKHSVYRGPNQSPQPLMQKVHMIKEDSDQFLTEADCCMGDVVVQFPNPDEMPLALITVDEAMEFLHQAIGTRCAIEFKTEQLDYAILHIAFQYAYFQLTDSKQNDLESKQTCKKQVVQTSLLEAALKLFFQEQDQFEEAEEYGEFVESIRNKMLQAINKNFTIPKGPKGKKTMEQKDLKKKLLTRGKYTIKTAAGVEKSPYKVRDFYTLSRNLILLRFAQKGFKIRTFIAQDYKTIYSVLYTAEHNISIVAQQTKMRKFLNLEFTDLLSLEPIDLNYRPLRLNNRLWRNDIEMNQSQNFQYLKPKIIRLLQRINFKKMAKELHIQNLNDQMFDYGQRDLIGDEEGPSDELWEAYYEYLVYLDSKVQEARERFYFKLDFAVLMNPSRHKKRTHQEDHALTKAQIKRVSKKTNTITFDTNEQERTLKEEQQIKRYQSYQKKKYIPKISKRNQQVKQYIENPLIICETYHKDFQSILLKFLIRITKDILNLEVDEKENNPEYYLRQLQHYFDDNENTEEIFQKYCEKPDVEIGLKNLIIQIIVQMKEMPQKIDVKQFTITRDKNPVYYDSIKQTLIESLFLTYMREEEKVWKEQIKQETEQFNNMKKIFHLKQDELCTRFLKERQRGLLAQTYGQAMREGMQIINNVKGNLLKCIWDFSFGELYNIAISSEYSVAGKGFSFKKKSRINTIWKKYQVSEKGRISVFSMMERIKLANFIVNQCVNIPYILNDEFALQIFGLNDQYELLGLSNNKLIKNELKSAQSTEADLIEYVRLWQEKYLIAESLFVKSKLHNLEEIWKMRLGEIWYVPSEDVRDYYGEKIALYFTFLGHYTKSLLIPGIIGLICSIIQSMTPPRVAIVIAMMFGIIHSQFLSVLLGTWKLKEKQIVAQFAQNFKQGKQQQEQRPSFQGEYRRDPCNDEANTLYYPFTKLFTKMIFNGIILGFVWSIYIGCLIGLFYMTKFFYEYDIFTGLEKLEFLKLEVSIPCSINVIILNIFDYFYESLSEHMTDQENHETVADFEANFIIKKFTLVLLSYFAPIFMIAFLNDELGIDCAYGSCVVNARYYFSSLFIILFIFNIKEVLQPIIHKLLGKKQEEPNFNDEFGQVNAFIEQEAQKESYFQSVDRYGTVDDYMEIIVQSGLLGLFAPLFPASMFIGFVWNALEMQTDKMKLLKYFQRPVPLDEQSIGIWSLLLEFLANFSLIFNTGVVFLMGKLHPDRQGPTEPFLKDVTLFLIIILLAFLLRFILEGLIPEATYEFISIMKRQAYLLRSTLENFKKKVSKMKRLKSERSKLSRYVIFKPYGTVLKLEKKGRMMIREESDEEELELELELQQVEIQNKQEKQADSDRDGLPEMLLTRKKGKILRKNIYHFDFPAKKFEAVHMQKEFEDKKIRIKRMLKFFDKNYTLRWCEQRLLRRRVYQQRRLILYKYLNIRKLKVYLESYHQLFIRYKKQQESKREDDAIEDNADKEQKTARINMLAKRRAIQTVRKVVILKSGHGVWFGQYRRQVRILRANDMIQHLQQIENKLRKLKQAQRLIPISMIKITDDKLIKERPRIFEEIGCLDVGKSSSQEVLKLLINSRNQYAPLRIYKSELVRNIEELYSLRTRKIEQIQSQTFHQEVPNYLTLDQEELKFLFIQQQKAEMRTLDFNLVKLIEKEKQKELWLIQQNYQLKVLEIIEIDVAHKNILFEDMIMQEFSLFDQFYFPLSKGVVGRILDSRYELLNGWTLFDTIKFRKSVELYYSEDELLQFLLNLLNSFGNPKDKKLIIPKSIYANKNKDRVGYTFHWMIYGNRDMDKEKIFLPDDPESNSNMLKMIYNAGMIIVYMISLGDIEHNKDYLIEKQAWLMNTYPIIFTILQEMLLSEKQRKHYGYVKRLCENECKDKDLFLEELRLSQQLVEDSKISQINYQDLKLYDQNELSNQLETQKLHQVLAQQLFRMDILYKLKLFKQLKNELNNCKDIAKIIYSQEYYMTHIANNFAFYCDRLHHQKIMLDFISIEFYNQLSIFFENLNLNGIYSYTFIPNLSDIYNFITKIERYTSHLILDDYPQQGDKLLIRKRLRVQADNYKELHQKLNQMRLKFMFLQAYGEMFKQSSTYAIDLFMKASHLCNTQIRQLIISINIGRLQKNKLLQIQFLSKIDCPIEYYRLKVQNLLIKLYLDTENYKEALHLCQIIKPTDEQCIFEQALHQETLTLHSQVQWCLDKYQYNYDYLNFWLQKYKATQSKHYELPLIGLYYLEGCINLLHYNYNFHLVEDYLQILYQFVEKNIFMVYYLLFKLLQIINNQLGNISYGIITQFDENSSVGQKKYLEKAYSFLPKSYTRQFDYISELYFELECNLQVELDYESQYLEIKDESKMELDEKKLKHRKSFIIAKVLFFKTKYPTAKAILDNTQCKLEGVIDAWKMKNCKMIDIFQDYKFQLNDLSWKNLFITFVFDLNNLNAQLVCQLAFKLIEAATQFVNSRDCHHLQQQFKIFYVKLLLEEYNNKDNSGYIDKSFEIKFFILTSLNSYLSDLSLQLLTEICDIEDRIQQKELIDYKDITIPVDKRHAEKKTKSLNDLFIVQSQLLEESGDPIAALKCLDVQYALILYDERFNKQIQQVFSQKSENDNPSEMATKLKVSIMKLFLNIFSCGQDLLKLRHNSLMACVEIVEKTAQQAKLKMNEFPTTKIIWDDFALRILDYSKPKQLEAFQKYKLMYYQCEWKLLEYYSTAGFYKEAHNHFKFLYNHYAKMPKEKNSKEEYVRPYFEFAFGVYFINIRQTDRAWKFFDNAVRRYRGLPVYYEDGALKIDSQYVTGNFRDKFTDDSLMQDLLNQFNHQFTLTSRCVINRCYTKLYVQEIDQHKLFRSIVRLLEKIRKTMGRKSILYVDALLVYAEYILMKKETNQFQTFKVAFKAQYFFTRKESEFFEPYIYKPNVPYKFFTPDDIEERLSETLITQWVQDILDQCYKFYREYFNSVNVTDHYAMVYCDILQYRIAFSIGRLYQAQVMLERAMKTLKNLCDSLEHAYAIMIYEGYALLCENLEKIQEENISILLECPPSSKLNTLTIDERIRLATEIYLRNEQISKFFDDYKNNGFEQFLLQKLEKLIEKPQPSTRTSIKKPERMKRTTTITLDVNSQAMIRQQAKLKALTSQNKNTNESLKIGNLGYYRKAYRTCKQIFKEQNPLYTRIEDRFIELCKQEERENQIE